MFVPGPQLCVLLNSVTGGEHANTHVSSLPRNDDKWKIESKATGRRLVAPRQTLLLWNTCYSYPYVSHTSSTVSSDVERVSPGEHDVRGSVFVFQFLAVIR